MPEIALALLGRGSGKVALLQLHAKRSEQLFELNVFEAHLLQRGTGNLQPPCKILGVVVRTLKSQNAENCKIYQTTTVQ